MRKPPLQRDRWKTLCKLFDTTNGVEGLVERSKLLAAGDITLAMLSGGYLTHADEAGNDWATREIPLSLLGKMDFQGCRLAQTEVLLGDCVAEIVTVCNRHQMNWPDPTCVLSKAGTDFHLQAFKVQSMLSVVKELPACKAMRDSQSVVEPVGDSFFVIKWFVPLNRRV